MPNSIIDYDPDDDILKRAAIVINSCIKISDWSERTIYNKLVEVRARLKAYGVFCAWLKDNVDRSYTWCLELIRRYENLPPTDMATLNNLTNGALRLLASPSVDESTRAAIIGVAAQKKVSTELAYVLANAPEHIRKAHEDETLSTKAADRATRAFKSSFPIVREFIELHEIMDGDVIQWVNKTYQNTQRREGDDTSWAEINQNEGALVYDDEIVPLREANKTQCDLYTEWRRRQHIETSRSPFNDNRLLIHSTFVVDELGNLIIHNHGLNPGDEGTIKAFVEVKAKADA